MSRQLLITDQINELTLELSDKAAEQIFGSSSEPNPLSNGFLSGGELLIPVTNVNPLVDNPINSFLTSRGPADDRDACIFCQLIANFT